MDGTDAREQGAARTYGYAPHIVPVRRAKYRVAAHEMNGNGP
jgi:hypothetical protein